MSNCPFTNQPCPHSKNIHIKETTINGIIQKNMCIVCGIAYLSKYGNAEITNQIFGMVNNVLQGQFVQQIGLDKLKSCPTCGCTLIDISNTSRIGCAECYNFFKEELQTVIENCQKAKQHVGKIPKNHLLNQLEKDIKIAIQKEEYEKAGEINKRIKELKNSTSFS